MSNVTPISPEPASQQTSANTYESAGRSTPDFDLSAELKRYELRRDDLLGVIGYETANRKVSAKKIAAARAELRMVERMISASKPRVRKVAAK